MSILGTVVKFPFSWLVKAKAIPKNPIADLAIQTNKPIVYLLPFHSYSDMLSLQSQTERLGLPDPFNPLIVGERSFPRTIFIQQKEQEATLVNNSIARFTELLSLHQNLDGLDVQLLPCSVIWGRKPGKATRKNQAHLESMGWLKKGKAMLLSGRDCLVRISPVVSLRYVADNHGIDAKIAHKLARVAMIHYSRQKLAVSGPNLPKRQQLIARLLHSEIIHQAIDEEAKSKKISHEAAQKNAYAMLDEIAADFSYSLVKKGDKLLGWLWGRIYQGLNIHNANSVRQLAQAGHEIVYLPCHRSHMDYLLLSYVLYHEGLVPPHIAAGINLNFFPAGPLFRRGGAFFIRRSFKGNKLYSTLFREYLADLFRHGYSVEYFSEGGRSRTGRLLPAKTGMLAMTLQAMLRGLNRPVTIVPVYIGYEHVMEVSTYAKELSGQKKEKESATMVLKSLKKLKNFGQGYVNFGQPITLNQYLNQLVPTWSDDINPSGNSRPTWLTPTVNQLAKQVMTHINDAAAPNALALCALALLASRQRSLTRSRLLRQLECYLALLQKVPYSHRIALPTQSAEQLLEHAVSLEKFNVEQDALGAIFTLDHRQAILLTYYRNNIIHLFVLPSLIAQILVSHHSIARQTLYTLVEQIYPLLKNELFLNLSKAQLSHAVDAHLSELQHQNLVQFNQDQVALIPSHSQVLILLGRTILETVQRYAITLNLIEHHGTQTRETLEQQSQKVAQRLAQIHGINAPEFFDQGVFSTLLESLNTEGYGLNDGGYDVKKIEPLTRSLNPLLHPEVYLTIQEGIHQLDSLEPTP